MRRRAMLAACVGAGLVASAAQAADPYPFEGSWVRADRTCSASPARERVYTAHDVTSPRGHCVIRRIVAGSGAFELFEKCERPNEKSALLSEIIRMTGPDTMALTRQTTRLKISRSLRFTRCPTPPVSRPQSVHPIR